MSNQNPIQNLKVGDKIMAADFAFTLVEVRLLGGGYFAGKAYTQIKLFKGARVFARFERIRVNTDRRLIAGELTTDGVGTQVIPEEWSQQYLSFTNEINHLFGEIEKGLDKVDEVLGKIDEVLKKVEEWVQNYQGEDKQELLETIRIGKKEIEEGKKKLKEGDTKEGLKKLKDGSGKVLGVGGKMVKEALETLFRDLKKILKELLQKFKRRKVRFKDSLNSQFKTEFTRYEDLRTDEVKKQNVSNNGDTSRITMLDFSNVNFKVPSYFKENEENEFKNQMIRVQDNKLQAQITSFTVELLNQFIDNPSFFTRLLEQMKKRIKKLPKKVLQEVSMNKKAFDFKNIVNKILTETIDEIVLSVIK